MKKRTSRLTAIIELLAVLLITAAAFLRGKDAAFAQRGYEAVGGEYMLLFIPAIYYTGKQIIADWMADVRRMRRRAARRSRKI